MSTLDDDRMFAGRVKSDTEIKRGPPVRSKSDLVLLNPLRVKTSVPPGLSRGSWMTLPAGFWGESSREIARALIELTSCLLMLSIDAVSGALLVADMVLVVVAPCKRAW